MRVNMKAAHYKDCSNQQLSQRGNENYWQRRKIHSILSFFLVEHLTGSYSLINSSWWLQNVLRWCGVVGWQDNKSVEGSWKVKPSSDPLCLPLPPPRRSFLLSSALLNTAQETPTPPSLSMIRASLLELPMELDELKWMGLCLVNVPVTWGLGGSRGEEGSKEVEGHFRGLERWNMVGKGWMGVQAGSGLTLCWLALLFLVATAQVIYNKHWGDK